MKPEHMSSHLRGEPDEVDGIFRYGQPCFDLMLIVDSELELRTDDVIF